MPKNTGQIFKGNEACFFISKPASFISLKMGFFTISGRMLAIFLRYELNNKRLKHCKVLASEA